MAGDGLVVLGARPIGLAAVLDPLPEEARREAVEVEGLGAERVEAIAAMIVSEADHALHGGEGLFREVARGVASLALERAFFVSVLHRPFVSGSDRSCEKWMSDYAIPGVDDLRLHHLDRAMAWLGEELAPAGDDDFAPRCVKDEIEERLFERRRDLFTDLSLVFMDTTTLSFHGAGGESLGAHGHSKDHRPDLRQMVLAVVLDGEGRPVCTEMLAGNVADMTVLLPVVDRLRKRFGIGRVTVPRATSIASPPTLGTPGANRHARRKLCPTLAAGGPLYGTTMAAKSRPEAPHEPQRNRLGHDRAPPASHENQNEFAVAAFVTGVLNSRCAASPTLALLHPTATGGGRSRAFHGDGLVGLRLRP